MNLTYCWIVEEFGHTHKGFMMEMLLMSSKRGVSMPEKRWPKAWTNRIWRGFKGTPLI